ncbi:MAG: glycogen debranching enzyme family protein, partial [Verrucomicrobia bacterium]|nr:glycogen debranching enzyme family protein [Verrucomicrobiota bacterium]
MPDTRYSHLMPDPLASVPAGDVRVDPSNQLASAPYLEWLESDGHGGYCMGTVTGVRTRRYHGLLLAAARPPEQRFLLVGGMDAWVESQENGPAKEGGPTTLARRLFPQLYANGVLYPPDPYRILSFVSQPWPRWELEITADNRLRFELIADEETSAVALRWRWFGSATGYRLKVRLLMAGRDYHSTHHENGGFNFQPENRGNAWCWRPYPGVPGITVLSNATYEHAPDWYRNFELISEKQRGLDSREDLATPGIFTWNLAEQPSPVIWLAATPPYHGPDPFAANEVAADNAVSRVHELFEREVTRRVGLRVELSSRQYLARGDRGLSVLAGFPWFADWGRDTFISMRGLCLAAGKLAEAAELLANWSAQVSEGMLPNRFAEAGQSADFN